jgi:hypothetical protein
VEGIFCYHGPTSTSAPESVGTLRATSRKSSVVSRM